MNINEYKKQNTDGKPRMDHKKRKKHKKKSIRWDKLIGMLTILTIIICAVIILATFMNRGDSGSADDTRKGTEEQYSQKETITQFQTRTQEEPTASLRTVCIDAGHGGKDGGADYGDQIEKTHNLAMAESVKRYLEQAGITVIMTRTTDVFLSLEQRVEIAHNKRAGIMVSLHRNYYLPDTSVNGVEAWIHHTDPSDAHSMSFGILDEINKTGRVRNRGVKTGTMDNPSGNYHINNHFKGVSCVLEIGFITNSKDNEFNTVYREECAKAIAQGIINYINEAEK